MTFCVRREKSGQSARAGVICGKIETDLIIRVVSDSAVDLSDIIGQSCIGDGRADEIIFAVGVRDSRSDQRIACVVKTNRNVGDSVFARVLNAVVVGIAPDAVAEFERRGVGQNDETSADAAGLS